MPRGVQVFGAFNACAAGSPQAFESLYVEEMSAHNTLEEIACCLFCYDTNDTNVERRTGLYHSNFVRSWPSLFLALFSSLQKSLLAFKC